MEQPIALGQARTGPLQGIRVADFSAIFQALLPVRCWRIRALT